MKFPEGNVAALVDRLRQVLRSPEMRRDLATRGRQRVLERYTQAQVAAQTVEVYRTMQG